MACAAYFTPNQLRQWRALDELEAKITELWGHLNAATYRFLALVAEFDREKAFERHGLANTAQWLNWQCGIGPVAAREKVRVARALEHLPEIADAFAKGEISYSKVRAMTRVATPANESVLVHVARHGTAAHVEKLVRKYRWTQRRDAAKLAQQQHEQRKRLLLLRRRRRVRLERALAARNRRGRPQGARGGRRSAAGAARNADDVSAETPLQIAGERAARRCAAAHRRDVPRAPRRGDRCGIERRPRSSRRAHRSSDPRRATRRERRRAASLRARRRSGARARYGAAARLRRDARRPRRRRRTASRSISAARPAAFRRRLRARCARATAAAASRAAIARASRDGHHVKHWADGGETKLGNLDHALRLPPPARARRRLRAHASRTTACSFSRGRTAGASRRTARNVSAETFCRARRAAALRGQLARLSNEPRAGPVDHGGDEPLPMARREHGLQSGHRGDAVSRAQSIGPRAVVRQLTLRAHATLTVAMQCGATPLAPRRRPSCSAPSRAGTSTRRCRARRRSARRSARSASRSDP